MANFNQFKNKILAIEGGYQSNESDRGNYTSSGKLVGTNMGISAKALEAWLGKEPVVSNMTNLSRRTALKIYEEKYWNKHLLYQFDSQELAEIVGDGIINHGPGNSNGKGGLTMLQDALNVFGEELDVDGIIGSQTIAAVNRQSELNGAALYNIYRENRIEYYNNIALYNPSQLQFLQGWLNRMDNHYPEKEEGAIITATRTPLGRAIDVAFSSKQRAAWIIIGIVVVPILLYTGIKLFINE